MRSFRLLAAGACMALFVSACTGGAPSPTTAPAAPTAAPAKPAAASPAASPAAAGSPSASPAASPKPAASPAAAASPSAAASPAASPVAGGAKPTVKMGSANFPEQVILGELYSQILEANGYTVERHLNLGT